MRKIRVFGWVIIAINLYFIISFFSDYDLSGDDTANGIGVMILFLWLAILNTVLYVLYRVTARQKQDKSNTLEFKLLEIENLKSKGLINDEEYASRRKAILES